MPVKTVKGLVYASTIGGGIFVKTATELVSACIRGRGANAKTVKVRTFVSVGYKKHVAQNTGAVHCVSHAILQTPVQITTNTVLTALSITSPKIRGVTGTAN